MRAAQATRGAERTGRARARRAAVVAGPAVAIAASAVAILLAGERALATRRSVAHTRDVIQAAQSTLIDLQDAETGQRGFLLTGDPAYLAPYRRAARGLAGEGTRLRALTRDNATQQRRLDRLEPVVGAKLAELAETVRLAEAGRMAEALGVVRTGRGRALMDSIRGHVDAVGAEERRLLADREEAETRAFQRTLAVVVLGGLLSAVLAWVANRVLVAAARREADQAEQLAEQTQLLEETNIELEEQAEALLASERRLRRLFDANVVGVIFGTVTGRIVDANDAFLRTLGFTRAQLQAGAVRWDRLGAPGWEAADRQLVADLRAGRVAPARQHEYVAADGQRVPVLVGGAPIEPGAALAPPGPVPDDGAGVETVAFVVDLTEQKRAEAEVRRLAAGLEREVEARTRDLREANAELEAFTYSVSHDLRAPLRAMQGFAAALAEDYGDRLDEVGREYAAFITSAARQMDQLIQDLLAFSRLGRAPLQLDPVDLLEVVGDARAQVRADLETAGAEVRVDPAPAGGGARGPVVLTDRRVAVQAVANLLTNAAKFVAPGVRPRIRVTVAARGTEGEGEGEGEASARVTVEDNGIGVAPEHRERIFRVFERLHSTEEYPGTGIGLAIVQRAAERTGGAAGLDAAPGGGTRAWIEWRLATATDDGARREAPDR